MSPRGASSAIGRLIRTWAILLLGPGVAAQTPDQSAADAPLRITDAASEITLDGRLDEPAWLAAAELPLPFEYFPGDNVPAPVTTRCLVTYDDRRLYVAFYAMDPEPEAIRAHLMDRDDIEPFVEDDHVGILVDTFNDRRRAFQLRVNPLGVQADAIFSELEGYEDFSWDIIWDAEARIVDDGYVIEMSIPFNQLRFERSGAPKTWGFQAFRSYPRSVRHRIASNPQDRDVSCILCQVGKIQGFEHVSPGRNLEVTPTATSIRTDVRRPFPDGAFDPGKVDVNPGLSARWSIRPNLVLNAALNPDFSQVEADAAQLDVNNRFALFYDEQRPFFLEGADFFLTPLPAVFTRTVADPIAGAKVTGKQGRNAIGLFITQDRQNTLVVPSNQFSSTARLEQDVSGAVARFRRDVGRSSTVGLLYTGRTGSDYFNHVGGVDGFFRLSPSNTVEAQVLRSTSGYPADLEARHPEQDGFLVGNAARMSFQHRSERWLASLLLENLDRDFRGDFGFFRRVDTRTIEASTHRVYRGESGDWYSQASVGLSAEHVTDREGRLSDRSIALEATYAGPLQSYAHASVARDRQRYLSQPYDMNRLQLFSGLQPSGRLRASLLVNYGGEIDFVNARAGRQFVLRPEIGLKLGRSVALTASHTAQRFNIRLGRLFTAHITESRLRYNFNVRTFVRLTLQYRTVERNLQRYDGPLRPLLNQADRSLLTQLLFSYKLNAQTVLFIGYSSNSLGTQAFETTRADQTLFFKVGYAIVS